MDGDAHVRLVCLDGPLRRHPPIERHLGRPARVMLDAIQIDTPRRALGYYHWTPSNYDSVTSQVSELVIGLQVPLKLTATATLDSAATGYTRTGNGREEESPRREREREVVQDTAAASWASRQHLTPFLPLAVPNTIPAAAACGWCAGASIITSRSSADRQNRCKILKPSERSRTHSHDGQLTRSGRAASCMMVHPRVCVVLSPPKKGLATAD